jgi:hypothetical protein
MFVDFCSQLFSGLDTLKRLEHSLMLAATPLLLEEGTTKKHAVVFLSGEVKRGRTRPKLECNGPGIKAKRPEETSGLFNIVRCD